VFNRRNTHRDLVGVRVAHALRAFWPTLVVASARVCTEVAGLYDAPMFVMAMSMGWRWSRKDGGRREVGNLPAFQNALDTRYTLTTFHSTCFLSSFLPPAHQVSL
jgi:hypothetical protein